LIDIIIYEVDDVHSEERINKMAIHTIFNRDGKDLFTIELERFEDIGDAFDVAICQKIDLRGADLSGVDLKEIDLACLRFREIDHSSIDLSDSDLSWANLSKANLAKINLSRANLKKNQF